MQKIMFNDKYGLTQAVLEGRKTQTRRIVTNRCLSGLTEKDVKVHTFEFGMVSCEAWNVFSESAKYKIGEEIALAQKYSDFTNTIPFTLKQELVQLPGWKNKMFVKADLMPHRIRITNIRVERLQDISEEDCLEEGIWTRSGKWYCYDIIKRGMESYDPYPDPREAYSVLIDRISGKGTWESNPWVFVYDFELVK